MYACVGDDVECGCAGYVVAKRVYGRVIVGGDECCCVCDCGVDKLDECRRYDVDVADEYCSSYIDVQLFCLRLRSVILTIII